MKAPGLGKLSAKWMDSPRTINHVEYSDRPTTSLDAMWRRYEIWEALPFPHNTPRSSHSSIVNRHTRIIWKHFHEVIPYDQSINFTNSCWTKKGREKAIRVEKEIVMLRQLLDEGLPKEAVSYLTLVSDCLKEIEKVLMIYLFDLVFRNFKDKGKILDRDLTT